MAERIPKVNDLIRDEIATYLRQNFEFPGGALVTVMSVDTSIDLYYTTVFISVLPKTKEQEVLNRLLRNIREIQSHMNRRLVMKYVPQLRFKIDDYEARQAELDKLIDSSKTQHDQRESDNKD